jgi:hypothetical protein
MANNLDSNVTRKVIRKFLPDMESQRVLSKTVDTQLFVGQNGFNPASGDKIDVKRPHRYLSKRTSDGDISAETDNSIISGKATATVQNYITVKVPFTNFEEALKLDQLEDSTRPAAEEIVTELETSFGGYMINNCGLAYGAPDTPVTLWSHVAGAKSLMQSLGVPRGNQYYAMNPFTVQNLADKQSALAVDSGRIVNTAWEEAQVTNKLGGLKTISTDSLSTRTSSTMADRAGTLAATPDATYVTAKDTMTQVLSVTGFTASSTLKAGEIIEVTGRFYTHQRTRQAFLDGAGSAVKWRCTVTADVTLDGSGAGLVTVTGPALFETNGQYNNIDSALTSGDVITVLGSSATLYQPNLFYHEMSFSIAFVKLPKLYSTDTTVVTKDGIMIRVSKYSDGDKNQQSIRFDCLPAFATLNPFYCGQGYGVA